MLLSNLRVSSKSKLRQVVYQSDPLIVSDRYSKLVKVGKVS